MQNINNRQKKIKDPTYVRPQKAAKKMKLAQSMNQTVYLYGVTGSGKTSLVRDMLNRRTYSYYSAEETNLEEIQISKDFKEQIIVIDDLYLVPDQQLREEYAALLKKLIAQRNIWLILISRSSIPRWLMPLYVQQIFLVIDEEDLNLSRKEQDAYFEKWNLHLTSDTADEIFRITGGNPLTLRLTALVKGNIEQGRKDFASYLETHVYDQWDMELQEFVMELSVVEQFDVQMARMVTGRNDVEQMIARVQEVGNFIFEKDGIYEYRPIVKFSMRRRLARERNLEQINRLYYNAGHMYEMLDQVTEALKMYEIIGNEEGIARILIANARKNPASGHYFQLRKYYLSLSEEDICKSPVLMAGMSMLQSMLMNEEQSEYWYDLLKQQAQKLTGSAKREANSRLLYLDIGLPHRGTVHMADILKHAGTLLRDRKVALPEFSLTSNLPSQMSGGKDFCEWSKKDQELAASIGKLVEKILGKYGKGLVSLALAESYLEKGMDNYEVAALAEKGRMQAESGGKAEQCFVAAGILTWLSVLNGNAQDAWDILGDFEQHAKEEASQLLPNLYAMQCRVSLYLGRLAEVMEWMETAPNENEEFCTMERLRYLTKVRVYLQNGQYQKAYRLLQQMIYYAEKLKRTYIYMETKLLMAITEYRLGEPWQETLQGCITQAQEYHFVRLLSREGGAIKELLRGEKFVWKDKEFQRQVLLECERMARYYPSYLKEKTPGNIVLSDNALQILRLQAEGLSTEKIAQMLGISKSTVKYHSQKNYRKLGVKGKAAAVNEARNRKMI